MGKKEKSATEIRKVRILDEAFRDIDQIADFIAIAQQQPLNAIKVNESIFDTIENVGRNPFAYREFEQIPTKTKCTARHFVYPG